LYPECKTGRKQLWWNWRAVACPVQGEAQQGSTQTEVSKGTVREEGIERDIRRTFKMLREV